MMVGGLYDGAEYKAFFIFDYKGHMCTNGWKQLNGSWFYCGANGKCVTGWNKIDGKWYYFDKSQDPYMYTGPQLIDGKCYLFGSDGSLQTGWYNYYAQWYYADSDGICATGWKQIDGKWYYFYEPDYSSPFMFGGGLYRIGENWYGFDDNGVMLTGWYNDYVIEEDGETLYLGEWYYLDKSNGQAKKGWAQIGNKWYYFQTSASYDPPYALSGINIIEGKYYYFDEDTNVMASDGWVKKAKTYGTNAVWFYADKKGALATGWQKIGNDWYYFGDGTYYPYMHRGIVDVDGDDYYLGTNGKLVTGWFREVDKYSGYVYPEYHYADKNGIVTLTDTEFAILEHLLKNRGKTVTAADMYEAVWNERFLPGSANTVMVHVLNLRRKIEENPSNPRIIRTVTGAGRAGFLRAQRDRRRSDPRRVYEPRECQPPQGAYLRGFQLLCHIPGRQRQRYRRRRPLDGFT